MTQKQVVRACVGVLFLFMGSSFLRFLTLNIFIEPLHIHNAFTRIVFFDRPTLETDIIPVNVDWTTVYPFTTAGDTITNQSSKMK
ncbi:MAG: hypothetical protein LBD93_04300 [Treponema sp.]|jgi:hypothetical protein|nr:hypothetical protein [Treponema sp.]